MSFSYGFGVEREEKVPRFRKGYSMYAIYMPVLSIVRPVIELFRCKVTLYG